MIPTVVHRAAHAAIAARADYEQAVITRSDGIARHVRAVSACAVVAGLADHSAGCRGDYGRCKRDLDFKFAGEISRTLPLIRRGPLDCVG